MTNRNDLIIRIGIDDDGLDRGLNQLRNTFNDIKDMLVLTPNDVIAGFNFIFKSLVDTQKINAKFAASFGKTREEMTRISSLSRELFREDIFSSYEESIEGMTWALKNFGEASDKELTSILSQGQIIKKLYGVELEDTFNSMSALMGHFGISAEQASGFIIKGFREGLNNSNDFLDSIQEYSTQFSGIGASAEEFFSTLKTGMGSGILGTDKVADAFKEARLKILGSVAGIKGLSQDSTQEIKDITDAFASLGINHTEVINQINNGSMRVVDVIQLVIGKLKDMDNSTQKMQIGTKILGTMFEDLGDDIIDNVDIASVSMGDLEDAVKSTGELGNNLQKQLTVLFKTLIIPKESSLTLKLFRSSIEGITNVLSYVNREFSDLISSFTSVVKVIIGLKLAGLGLALVFRGLASLSTVYTAIQTLLATQTIGLTARFHAWRASIIATEGSLNKLRVAMTGLADFAANLFLAAFIGWEIGKYFWNEFEEVRKASYWVVGEVLIAWEQIQQFIERIPDNVSKVMIVMFGILIEKFTIIPTFFEYLAQQIKDFWNKSVIFIKKQIISLMEKTSDALYFVPGATAKASALLSKVGVMEAQIKQQEKDLSQKKDLSQMISDNQQAIQDETQTMLALVDAESVVNDEHAKNIKFLRESQDELISSTNAQEEANKVLKKTVITGQEKVSIDKLQELQLNKNEEATRKLNLAIIEANQELQKATMTKPQQLVVEAQLEFGDTNKAKELAQIKLMTEYYKDITQLQQDLAKATMTTAQAKEYDAKLNYGEALGKQRAEIQRNVDVTTALYKATVDFQKSTMTPLEAMKFDVEFELGDQGQAVAQIKQFTDVSKELVDIQNDVAKATISVVEAKKYDLSLQHGEKYGAYLATLEQGKDVLKELVKSQDELAKATMTAAQAKEYDASKTHGKEYGAYIAQLEQAKDVLTELTKSQHELAKATMTTAQAKEYDLKLQYGNEYGTFLARIEQTQSALSELTKSTQEFTTASLSAKDARLATLKLEYPDYLAKELALSQEITSARKDLTSAMLEYNKAGMSEMQAKEFDLSQQYNQSIAHSLTLIASLTQAKQALSAINDQVATSEMSVWEARQFELSKKYPEVIAEFITQLEMLVSVQQKVVDITKQLETAGMGELEARKAQLSLDMPSYMANIIAQTESLVKFEGELADTTRELAQSTMTEYEARVATLSLKYPQALAEEYATLQTLVQARTELTNATTAFNEVGLTEYELQQKRLSSSIGEVLGTEIAQIQRLTQVKSALIDVDSELNNIGLNAFELREKELQQNLGDVYGKQVASAKNLIDIRNEQLRLEQELTKAGGDESLIKRLELEKQFPSAIAEQIVQIERLTELRKAQIDAEQQANDMLAQSNLTEKQREYVSVLQEVGIEVGKQVIQTRELTQARMEGMKVISDMQAEIDTMDFSETERERYELLKQVAPEQQEIVNQLYNQKQALIESKKELEANRAEWQQIADSAGNYFEKFMDGEMSAREALTGFFDDIVKQQQKAMIESAKEQFMNLVVGVDTEQDDQQKVIDAVNASREAIKTDIDKASQFVAENVKDSTLELGRISSETIQQMTSALSSSYEVNTQQLVADVQQTGDSLSESVNTSITNLTDKTQQNIQIIIEGIRSTFSQFSQNLSQNIDKTAQALGQVLNQTVQALASTMDKTLNVLHQSITNDIGRISKAMELSITSMTGALSSLQQSVSNDIARISKSIEVAANSMASSMKTAVETFNNVAGSMANAGQSIQTASSEFTATAKNLPDIFKGITGSVSDLKIKGGYAGGKGQAVAGGKTQSATFGLAQVIQNMLGEQLKYFSAFDDAYHNSASYKAKKIAAGKNPSSVHQTGRALDVVLQPQFTKLSGQIEKQIKDIGKLAGVTISTLNEYRVKTAGGTGGHIHVNFKSQADADKFQTFITQGGQAIKEFNNSTQVATKVMQDSTVALKSSTDVARKNSYTIEDSMKIIANTAKKFGIDMGDFLAMGKIESNFQAGASRGAGGAKGLFQFIPSTAKQYGIKGQELDPFKNAEAAAKLWNDNAKIIAKLFGEAGKGNLSLQYLAHQQGAGGLKQISRAASGGQGVSEDVRKNMINNIMGDVKEMIGITKSQLKAMSTANPQEFASKFLEAWNKKISQRKSDALDQVKKVAGDVFAVEKGSLKQAQVITQQDIGSVQALQQSSVDVAKAQQEITDNIKNATSELDKLQVSAVDVSKSQGEIANISQNAANELQKLAVSGSDTTQAFNKIAQEAPTIKIDPLDIETDIVANLPQLENNLSEAINEGIMVADVAAAKNVTVDLSITTETLANGLSKANLDSNVANEIKQFSMLTFDETGKIIAGKISVEQMDSNIASSIQSLAMSEFNLTSEQVANNISEELQGKLDNRVVELVRNQAVFDLGYTAEDIATGLSQEGIDKIDTRIAEILKQQAINELGLTEDVIAQGLTDATKDKIDDRVSELLRSQVAFELTGTATQISDLSKEELAKVDDRVKKIMSSSGINMKETEQELSKKVVDATLHFDKKIAQNVTARANAKLNFTEEAVTKNLNHELIQLDKAIVDELQETAKLGLTQEQIDSGVFNEKVSEKMTESLRSFVMGSMELTEQDLAANPIQAQEVEARIAELMQAPAKVIEKSDEIVMNELRQAVSKGMGFSGTMEEIASLTTEALGEIDGNVLDYLRQQAALDMGLSEQAIAGKLNDESLAKIDENVAQKLRAMLIEKMGYTEQQIAENLGGAADNVDANLAQLLSQVSPNLNATAMQMAMDLAKAQGIALETALAQVMAQMGQKGGFLSGIAGGGAFDFVNELSSTFSGDGIMGSIGDMFSGGGMFEGIGKAFTEGIFSKSGAIGSIFSESGAIGSISKALGGFGNALGIGKSLLDGDFKGAILGAVGAINPMIGAAATFVADFIGLGAQWVRESEWVRASIRGTTEGLVGDFDKGFKEVKDAMIGGGERVGYEALDEGTVKQLNEALGKTNEIITKVSQSLGFGNNSLLASFTDFTYHIEAFEDKGDEWFTKQMEQMAVNAIKHSVRAIKIPDPDATVSDMVAGDIANYIAQIVGEGSQSASEMTTTFSQEARQAMWDGVMRGLGEASKEERDRVREAVTGQLQDYVASMNEAFVSGEITTDEINSQLKAKAQELFSQIAGVSIPEGVAQDLADRITMQITDVVEFIKTGISDFVITDDIEFFTYFKDAVQEFDGTEEEITAFINNLLNLKDTFNEVGLNTAFINESMTTALGGIEGFTEAMGMLTSNFLSTNEAYAFADSLDSVEKAVSQTGMSLPTTRDEFNNLIRGLDATTESGQETFKALLQNVDSFDKFYSGIEWFEDSFNSVSKKTVASLQQYVDQVADGFSDLGIEVPKTRKEFYDLVSALDLTQESDRQLYGSLISLAPAFDNLHTAFEDIKSQFFSFQASDLNLLDTIFSSANAKEAGENFSNNFMASFYDQFIGGFMSIIEQTVFDSIISPLTDSATMMAMNISESGANAAMNLAEGGISSAANIAQGSSQAQIQMATGGATAGTLLTTSGQLTAEALAGIVSEVEQQLNIMTQVMGALNESGVMENVATAMADIGASSFSSVTSMQAPMQTYQVATPDRFGGMFKPVEKELDKVSDSVSDAAKEIEEKQKIFKEWQNNISDFNTGLEGNDLVLHNLSKQYDGLFDVAGKSAQQLGEEWGKLSQSELEGIAGQAGVELNQLTSDMMQFINITDEAAKATDEAAKAQEEFNSDIQNQLSEFSLEGIDLEMFNLNQWREEQIAQANELGTNLVNVDALYNAKRLKIEEDFNKQRVDYNKGIQQEIEKLSIDGIDLEFLELDRWYQEQIQAANEVGGDLDQLNQLYQLKSREIIAGQEKMIADFQDGFDGMAKHLEGTALEIFKLNKQFAGLDAETVALSMTSEEYAKWIQSLNYNDLIAESEKYGVSIEELTQGLETLGSIVEQTDSKVADFTKAMSEQANNLSSTQLTSDEKTLIDLNALLPDINVLEAALTTDLVELTTNLATANKEQLVEIAKSLGIPFDLFLEKMPQFISASDNVQKSWDNFKEGLQGLTDESTGTLGSIQKLAEQFPQFNLVADSATLNINEISKELMGMTEVELLAYLEATGLGLEEAGKSTLEYLNAVRSLQQGMDGFRNDMATTVMQLQGMSNAQISLQQLGSTFNEFGSTALDVATNLSTLSNEDILNKALELGIEPDELYKRGNEYVNALKTTEDEAAKARDEALKAQEEAQKQALEQQKKLQEEQAKAIEDANKKIADQIKELRSLFDELSSGLKSVYDSISDSIKSFTPEDVIRKQKTDRLAELRGSVGNIDLSQINLSNADFVRQVTKDFDELNSLVVDDANERIAAIESERDKARELHDQKIQQYEAEADRLKQLFDDAMGVVDSISDDIFEINRSMGKAGTSPLEILDKQREQYAASFQQDHKARIESANNLRSAIKDAMDFQIAEVEKNYDVQVDLINENFDKQKEALETARDNQIANIEAQADAEREAAQSNHDTILAQLDSQYEAQQDGIESEFEAKKNALEAQQAAAEELRDLLLDLKNQIKGVRDSLVDDMLSLRREMGDPKASFTTLAKNMRKQITSAMQPTTENIAKVDEYRSLVLEAMNEQIAKEQEKADLIAESQQVQLDNAQALRDFAEDLKGWLDDIAMSDLSNLTNTERLNEAQRQYQETLKLAQGGDEKARSELTQKAQQYLEEAQSYYASSGAYAGDTGIYETVRSQVSGLATTSTAQAAKIEKQVNIDQTVTGKNTDAIKQIQQTALQELQRLDMVMAQMDMSVNEKLATPAATPLPEEQFQAQLAAIDSQTNALLEQAKIHHEQAIANENARFELEQKMINQREAIAKEEANARYEANLKLAEEQRLKDLEKAELDKEEMITAIKEAYIVELENIAIQMEQTAETLGLMYDKQIELANRSFAEDPWASQISEIQSNALFELQNMRQSIVDANDRLGIQMTDAISKLMTNISSQQIITDLGSDILDVPSFDVGTDYVEKDTLANVHEGEIIIDPVTARQLRQYGINVTGTTSKTDTSKIEELLAILLEQVELSRQDSAQDTAAMVEAITELENTVTAPLNRTLKNIEGKGNKRR